MSRLDTVQQIISEQNGRKKFVQQISISTSGVLTPIKTKSGGVWSLTNPFVDEYGIPFPPGSCLVLQGSVDFLYKFQPTTFNGVTLTTAITQIGSTHPGIYVQALYAQEYTLQHGNASGGASNWGADTQIDLIAASASGVVNVWLVN